MGDVVVADADRAQHAGAHLEGKPIGERGEPPLVDQRVLGVASVCRESIGLADGAAAAFVTLHAGLAMSAGVGVEADDAVLDGPTRDVGGHFDDLASKFVALNDGCGEDGMTALAFDEIALCDCAGTHSDQDVARGDLWHRELLPLELVGRARLFEDDGLHTSSPGTLNRVDMQKRPGKWRSVNTALAYLA